MAHGELNYSSTMRFCFFFRTYSVLKFKELGIESFFVPIEADGKVFKDHGLKKISTRTKEFFINLDQLLVIGMDIIN